MRAILLSVLVIFAIAISLGSIAYYFSSDMTGNNQPAGGDQNILAGKSGSAIGVGLYGADGKLLGALTDSSGSFALYQINSIKDAYSLYIAGQVCVKSPYKIVIEGTSNSPMIQSALNSATFDKEIGKLPDGRSVAELKANECAKFATTPIIIDELGASKYQVSFKASGYTTYENGQISKLIEVADSNTMNLNITMQPSIQVTVDFTSNEPTTTQTQTLTGDILYNETTPSASTNGCTWKQLASTCPTSYQGIPVLKCPIGWLLATGSIRNYQNVTAGSALPSGSSSLSSTALKCQMYVTLS